MFCVLLFSVSVVMCRVTQYNEQKKSTTLCSNLFFFLLFLVSFSFDGVCVVLLSNAKSMVWGRKTRSFASLSVYLGDIVFLLHIVRYVYARTYEKAHAIFRDAVLAAPCALCVVSLCVEIEFRFLSEKYIHTPQIRVMDEPRITTKSRTHRHTA